MVRVLKRTASDPHDLLVILETDSTGTSVVLVSVHDYVHEKEVSEYHPVLQLRQLDMDELEEVEPERKLCAVFMTNEGGYDRQMVPWMLEEQAQPILADLREVGYDNVHLAYQRE